METSRQQEQQLRRMGREAVTKAIQAANANSGGMRRVTAKVTRVNSDYTVDVDMGDSAYSMPITGLRYTTSCFGVRVGDTVLVDVVGHLATVTGILATADNGPYVDLPWTPMLGSLGNGAAFAATSGVVSVSVVNVTVGAGQTRRLGNLPADIRPKTQALAVIGGSSLGSAAGWLWVSESGEVSVCATSQANLQGTLTYVLG